MTKKLFRPFGLLVAAATAIALAGCAPQQTSEAESKPTIVATTNVWADVAKQIAGENFEVIALISDTAIDPHSYEASARDQLAVSESSLFIVNGGGYDEFALTLASAAGIEPFNVYEMHEGEHSDEEHADDHSDEEHSEEEHSDEEHSDDHDDHSDHGHDGSDHIWYSFEVAHHVAEMLAERLSAIQPANADEFAANAEAFIADIEALEQRTAALANSSVHYFEAHPLAALLFKELGFENLTPEGFAEAEEAELEPSVAIVAESRELISSGKLSFLALNAQVTSQTLEQLRELAEAEGVAVLEFGELLPEGVSYQEWANSVLDLIESAS
jgi:zinc/manganese transport system substrate-binding protein